MSVDSLLMFSEIYGVSTDYILKGGTKLWHHLMHYWKNWGHWYRNIITSKKKW